MKPFWPFRRALPADIRGGPASVPQVAPAAETYEFSPSVPTVSDPRGPSAAAFQRLADDFTQKHLADGCRGAVVCGVSIGTGATFTATNLAVALAQSGVRTLLVDANLRRPEVHTLIRPPRPSSGLDEMLRSGADPRDAIHSDVLPDLSIIYGAPASDAAELVVGDRLQRLFGVCLRNYDCTIVDTPHANQFPDALNLAAVVRYALIVGRKERSYVDDVKFLSSELNGVGAKVVGSIFNEA